MLPAETRLPAAARRSAAALFAGLGLLLGACGGIVDARTPAADNAPRVGDTTATARAAIRTAEVTIIGVIDGDTVSAQLDGQRVRLRLARIDAPERRQPWGRRSEQSLRELVWKKRVQIAWSERDRYGRPLVEIRLDGKDVAREQLRRGMAWVYRPGDGDTELLALEREARAARRGLWADPSPIAPWDWRQRQSGSMSRGAGSGAVGAAGARHDAQVPRTRPERE